MFGPYFNSVIEDATKRAKATGRRHYIGKFIDEDPRFWSYTVSTNRNDTSIKLGYVDPNGQGLLRL